MTSTQIIAIVIFLVTMAAIMTEKLHRTVAAVAGALLLILTGVLSVESGFSYVDLNTLGVLIGMMLFVAVVKNSGIFEYIAIKAAKIAKGRPWPLMVLFALITAVLSAFLDNVTTVLLIGRQDVEEIVAGVEWTTILFFTGLFIVVGGLQETGVIQILANGLMDLTEGHMTLTILLILWVSAIVSSFLDNIPFVATLIPLILTMQSSGVDVTPLWWAVSLGACLGGNGTLIGASANVVLSGISNRHGFPITFASYFKVGFPLMLVSVAISTVFLLLRFT